MTLETLLKEVFATARMQYSNAVPSKSNTVGISQQELADMLASAEESQEVRGIYLSVTKNTLFGKAMDRVMDVMGYERKIPDHYTILDLPQHVGAATITLKDNFGNETIILAYNSKYMESIRNNPFMRLYVNLHEHGYIRGERSEALTEGLVGKAANYVQNFLEYLYNGMDSLKKGAATIRDYAYQRKALQAGR